MSVELAGLPPEAQQHVGRMRAGEIMFVPEHDLVVEKTLLGVVKVHCIKCFAHRMVMEIGEEVVPTYSHQFLNPMSVKAWNVGMAWRLVRASGRKPTLLDPMWLKGWLDTRSSLIPGHLDHIPPEHLEDPVLCDVQWVQARLHETGAPLSVPFPMLIDGHHRAARSVRDGFPLYGFVLTDEEREQVVTTDMDAYEPELMGWMTREQAEQLPEYVYDPLTNQPVPDEKP